MACQYYAQCLHCSQYNEERIDEEKCEIFGYPIGDGSPYCRYFCCNIDECKRGECISQEEIYAEAYL